MERRLLLLSDWCLEHADRLASRRYKEFPPPPAEEGSVNWYLQQESHRLSGRIIKEVVLKKSIWNKTLPKADWPNQKT